MSTVWRPWREGCAVCPVLPGSLPGAIPWAGALPGVRGAPATSAAEQTRAFERDAGLSPDVPHARDPVEEGMDLEIAALKAGAYTRSLLSST